MGTNDELGEGSGGFPESGRFETVGGWYKYVISEGFSVPVQVPHAISRVKGAFGLDNQGAFDWLVQRRLLIVRHGVVVVDMRATHIDLSTVPEHGLD